jgi:hypothetical protein
LNVKNKQDKRQQDQHHTNAAIAQQDEGIFEKRVPDEGVKAQNPLGLKQIPQPQKKQGKTNKKQENIHRVIPGGVVR